MALSEVTWALVAHEVLIAIDPSLHILGEGRPRPEWFAARIVAFAPLDRALADGAGATELAATASKL